MMFTKNGTKGLATLTLISLGIFLIGATSPRTASQPGIAPAPAVQPVAQQEPTPAWQGYEEGFEQDASIKRGGAFGIRVSNKDNTQKRGGCLVYELNQKSPTPVVLTGWSKADNVGGVSNVDYSLYADLEYDDGTPAYGYASAFDPGTHDWQRRRITITPDRPIKKLLVYGLLRGHTGTAWFDDFSVTTLSGKGVFDSQPLAPPTLQAGKTSGWFVRDVAANGPLLPLTPGGTAANGLILGPVEAKAKGLLLSTTLAGDKTRNRAVTLYYVERFDRPNPVWWRSIRESERLSETEGSNAVRAGDTGAIGSQTRYPFGCVTSTDKGRALALPPDSGPRIVRIGYHPEAKLLYIAFDLALMPERAPAPVSIVRYDVSPEWGFRDAARQYYALFPQWYTRRTAIEGIWLPFTAPHTVPKVEDFGIAWHEGDNSVADDDTRGILSFRYAEPMSFWMVMPPEESRDYDTAYARLTRIAAGKEKDPRNAEEGLHQAMATLASGSRAPNGKLNVEFQNAPWANGAVWTLNPNPRMPGEWNKARVNFDRTDADTRYGKNAKGTLDGEYLDSMEGWAHTLDYGSTSLRASVAPPTFASETFQPTIPTWFSVWEYTYWLRTELDKRKKLIMGNSTPWSIYAFAPLLDSFGTETNWLGTDGTLRPESDALMAWRRTLAGRKPYLLLMNTDYDKFDRAMVEKYFARCAFYGIFPSMFSVNAADKPYWENPKWYDRDRALFKQYIPLIKSLSAAGWEPVTYARTDTPTVYLERYGTGYLTVLNSTEKQIDATITVDVAALKRNPSATVTEMLTSAPIPATTQGKQLVIKLNLPPGATRILQLK